MYDDASYRRRRKEILAGSPTCWRCGAAATTVDHVPPLSTVEDPAHWEGELRPACGPCNFGHGLRRDPQKGRRRGPVTYRRDAVQDP